jgi:hypothetical protein
MHNLKSEPDRAATALGDITGLLREGDMDSDEILGLYPWSSGACFRCARGKVDTTHLAEICTPAGAHYDVRACRACVLELEDERRRYAERRGLTYRPGRLGS